MGEYRANGGDSVGYSLCTAALASLALKLVTESAAVVWAGKTFHSGMVRYVDKRIF